MRRLVRTAAPLALLTGLGCAEAPGGAPESEADLVERARGIHERVVTVDTHVDIRASNFTPELNYTMELPTQVDLPSMEAGGLDVAWLIVYAGQGLLEPTGYAGAMQNAMEKFDAIHRLAEEIAPDRIEIAYTSGDVRRIAASGKKVAMIGIENAYPVGLDLENIRRFRELGGLYMSLSHNGHSQFSDSNTGERDGVWLHDGLSDLGREAIREMNRHGIMIDVSHPSKAAIMQMLELSEAPVIASHSSARAMNDHSRNLDDEQLLAIRDNGGVVQAVAFRSYVDSEKHAAWQAARQAVMEEEAEAIGFEMMTRQERMRLGVEAREAYSATLAEVAAAADAREEEVTAVASPVDVADFVDHIDYMVELIGIEHVGISSDFDGGGGVDGWMDASETFNVTLELVRRGYSEEEIGLIWGGNLLRVLDEVQAVSARMQSQG